MANLLESYAEVVGQDVIDQLHQLAGTLRDKRVVHVNSTRFGGGVAEILEKHVPLMRELGIETHWEVITGDALFYQCTKNFHKRLQCTRVTMPTDPERCRYRVHSRSATFAAPQIHSETQGQVDLALPYRH